MLSWSALYILIEWAIRLIMLVVVPRRREPASAMAWLVVIFFAPVPGFLVYAVIGRHRLPRRRIRLHRALTRRLRSFNLKMREQPSSVQPRLGAELNATVQLASRLGQLPILGGNHFDIIIRTDDFIERLIEDINQARHHVHLLFYIYANDATGRKVHDALVQARQRGVTCRVLVDAVGSRPMIKRLGPEMMQSGIEVRQSLPVGLFRRQFERVDLRNHRKIAVIDGRIGYTGSQNIVDADYGYKDLLWEDLMVRLTGPVVLELQSVFAEDWYCETDEVLKGAKIYPSPEVYGEVMAQTLPSGPNYPTENYQRLVVAALHAARERAIITTPYFVPDEPFRQALQIAAMRGIRVDLIVPHRSNHPLVDAASRAYYEELLESGVQIHRVGQALVHAKTMSIDDKLALIGSGNFDIRSFTLNLEINMIFYGPEATKALRTHQQAYIDRSEAIQLEQWKKRPDGERILQNSAKLLSPLL
jgi:cardiolipin synthase